MAREFFRDCSAESLVHLLDGQCPLRLREYADEFADIPLGRQEPHAAVSLDEKPDPVAGLEPELEPHVLRHGDLSFARHLGFAHIALPIGQFLTSV